HEFATKAGNSDYLVSAGFAAGYGNGGAGNFKQIREEFNHRLVGAAFQGRRGQVELQRVTHNAGNGVLARARVDLDGEGHTLRGFIYRKHCRREKPNSAATAIASAMTCGFCLSSRCNSQGTAAAKTANSSRLAKALARAASLSSGRATRTRFS